MTRAEVLATLGLQDKSTRTGYRALKTLEAAGCKPVPIGRGLWKRSSLYAALDKLAS